MNYNATTKQNLVNLLELKDKDLEKLDELKEEQTIFYDIKEDKNKLQAINIKKK